MKIRYSTFIFASLLFVGCGNDPEKRTESDPAQIQQSADSLATFEVDPKNYVEAYDRALKLWNMPLEEKDIKTSFGNAHVIVCGPVSAPPLILLHGMNASSTMWYPNIQALSKQNRIYAIDFLLEPGKSVCEGDMDSTDEIVTWYYEIFDKLQLKKFNLLGASRGGWLAINIALHSPERINKVALLSPAQAFTWIKPGADVISNVTYNMAPKRKRLRNVLSTMTTDVDNISQVYINQYYIATKEATSNKCILQMTPFSEDQLKSLAMPILVLIGDDDIINGESSLNKAKENIPDVETGIIKNAGHFLSIDQAEIVNRRVLEFLKGDKKVSVKR